MTGYTHNHKNYDFLDCDWFEKLLFSTIHLPSCYRTEFNEPITFKFVYVIGLHAVQFGNNWMRKILRTAKIGRGRRPSPIWQSEEFF